MGIRPVEKLRHKIQKDPETTRVINSLAKIRMPVEDVDSVPNAEQERLKVAIPVNLLSPASAFLRLHKASYDPNPQQSALTPLRLRRGIPPAPKMPGGIKLPGRPALQ